MIPVISNSFASGKRPGVVFEVEEEEALDLIAKGAAAPVKTLAPPEEVDPEVEVLPLDPVLKTPEAPTVLGEALDLEPWPVKGPKPSTYLKAWPFGKKAALARKHLEFRKAVQEAVAGR